MLAVALLASGLALLAGARSLAGVRRSGAAAARRPAAPGPWPSRWLPLGVGSMAAALHVHSLAAAPVADWAQDRAVATVELVVAGDPRAVLGRSDGPWRGVDSWQVPAHATMVRARGEVVAVDLPVVLRLAGARDPTVEDWRGAAGRRPARAGAARYGLPPRR